MKVVFRFEETKAQIILEPSSGVDQSNLANIMVFNKGINIKMAPGANKALIIEATRNTEELLPVSSV